MLLLLELDEELLELLLLLELDEELSDEVLFMLELSDEEELFEELALLL